MFKHKEYLEHFEPEFVSTTDEYLNSIFDWLDQFDTDIADFQSDQGQYSPPATYWDEKEPYGDLEDTVYVQSKFAWRVHFYYGIRLYHLGTTMNELHNIEPLFSISLQRISEYNTLVKASNISARQALAYYNGHAEYVEKWALYNQRRLELYAKSYIWAGYLTAKREDETIIGYEKSFPSH